MNEPPPYEFIPHFVPQKESRIKPQQTLPAGFRDSRMIGNSGGGGEELAPTKSDRWPTDHAAEGENKRMAYPS